MNMLESLKNLMIGKVHMPHSQMIDYGIHSATFEAASIPKQSMADKERIESTIALIG